LSCPDARRSTVAGQDELQATCDAALHIRELAAEIGLVLLAGALEALELSPELVGEGVQQVLVADEEALQAAKNARLKVGGRDAVLSVARALLPARVAVVAIPAGDGHGAPAAAASDEAREQALLGLAVFPAEPVKRALSACTWPRSRRRRSGARGPLIRSPAD
jgi:hypothetical protein